MEEKDYKYNHGVHVPLDSIPIEDTELALMEFADGSPALLTCLRIMWMNGIKTYSAYHGEKHAYEIGHIVLEEDEDVFSYLSKDLLEEDNRIRIDVIDKKQEIKFAGTAPEKEGAMFRIAREIQTGRKNDNHNKLIEEKIGEPFPTEWVRRLKSYDSNPDSTYWSEKVYIKKKNYNDKI